MLILQYLKCSDYHTWEAQSQTSTESCCFHGTFSNSLNYSLLHLVSEFSQSHLLVLFSRNGKHQSLYLLCLYCVNLFTTWPHKQTNKQSKFVCWKMEFSKSLTQQIDPCNNFNSLLVNFYCFILNFSSVIYVVQAVIGFLFII